MITYQAAATILVVCTVFALVLAAPLLYWLRRKRRGQPVPNDTLLNKRMSPLAALPGIVLVVLLYAAFSLEYIAPNSWLGLRLAAPGGTFWLFVFVNIAWFALEQLCRGLLSVFKARRSRL